MRLTGDYCHNACRIGYSTHMLQTVCDKQLLCSHLYTYQIPGYARKLNSGGWSYSPEAMKLLEDFLAKFPVMFQYLSQHPKDDKYYEADLFPDPDGYVCVCACVCLTGKGEPQVFPYVRGLARVSCQQTVRC